MIHDKIFTVFLGMVEQVFYFVFWWSRNSNRC